MGTIKKSHSELEDLKESTEKAKKILNIAEVIKNEQLEADEKQENKNKLQLVNFRLPLDIYNDYKQIFASAGYSTAQGIRMVLDWFYHELKADNLELSTCGIRETLTKKMKN